MRHGSEYAIGGSVKGFLAALIADVGEKSTELSQLELAMQKLCLIAVGFLGGLLCGWMAVGTDLLTFFILSFYLKWPTNRAIPAAIQVAGHTSICAAVIQFFKGVYSLANLCVCVCLARHSIIHTQVNLTCL